MEQNKSLSARIRRRNKRCFKGLGTNHFLTKDGTVVNFNTARLCRFGDYTDPEQNGKKNDYAIAAKRKNKLGFKRFITGSINERALTKKYADGHQRLSK